MLLLTLHTIVVAILLNPYVIFTLFSEMTIHRFAHSHRVLGLQLFFTSHDCLPVRLRVAQSLSIIDFVWQFVLEQL